MDGPFEPSQLLTNCYLLTNSQPFHTDQSCSTNVSQGKVSIWTRRKRGPN